MTYFTRFLTATAIGMFGLPIASHSEQRCAARDLVIQRLATQYGEIRQSIGLAPNNGVFEVYASHDTGSWTILVTSPNGMSCLVASGQAFETVAAAHLPAGDDA